MARADSKSSRKYFPGSEEMQKGHMRSIKAGVCSTKTKPTEEAEEETTSEDRTKRKELVINCIDLQAEPKGKISSDQTGRFSYRSFKGNQYLMIILESDSNAILYQPVKSKESGDNVKAWKEAMERLNKCGIKPKHQIMDNEVSAEWKEAIENAQMTYQLAPPGGHTKEAEKAVQVAKDHFIAILCGTSNNFPMKLWDRLLPQAEATLCMLRPARVAPNVSAFAYLYGQHNFNAHPLAPLGMEVEMHVKPGARDT